ILRSATTTFPCHGSGWERGRRLPRWLRGSAVSNRNPTADEPLSARIFSVRRSGHREFPPLRVVRALTLRRADDRLRIGFEREEETPCADTAPVLAEPLIGTKFLRNIRVWRSVNDVTRSDVDAQFRSSQLARNWPDEDEATHL